MEPYAQPAYRSLIVVSGFSTFPTNLVNYKMIDHRMKPLCILVSFCLLGPVLTQAQTGSSVTAPKSTTTSEPAVRPPATRPAASDASTSPNRRQELYDQYHGITKKPAPAPATSPTPATTTSRPARESAPKEETVPATSSAPAPVVAREEKNTESFNQNSGVRIGVRGGITYPVFLETTAIDPTLGFVGGVVFQFGRGKLSFQPEINYSRTSQTIPATNFSPKQDYSTDQIVVPLFLKIASGTFDGNRFFVNIGPYGSYVASTSLNGIKRDISGSSGRFFYGGAAGIGAMIKLGPGHATIEARGLYGLGNDLDGFYTDSKTILAEGTIGYVFPLGGR